MADKALAKVVRNLDPEEEAFVLVSVGDTEWGVATGCARELPTNEVCACVIAFEILRKGTTTASPYLCHQREVQWFMNADGSLAVAFVRNQNQPDLAEVYVGWPVYVVEQKKICET